jgi:hypothetical protein
MEPISEYAQLPLRFVDSVPRRYEVLRPLILLGERTTAQRAEEPQLPPETVRDLTRRFRQQGMLGLFPEQTDSVSPHRGKTIPAAVMEELARLQALDNGFGDRALARILWHKTPEHIDDKTATQLWQQSLPPVQGALPWPTYHSQPQRYLAEYHWRYDWREHKVPDIRDGVFYAPRLASPQGSLVPLTPQESLVLYRPRPMAHQAPLPFPAQQLWLFELGKTA